MQRQRKVRGEPFVATDDSGKEYRLCVVETQIDVTDTSNRKRRWKTIAKEIEVEGGGIVNYKGPGHYELVTMRGTITLRSTDENAT